jgi:pimeloyl-ACP methyl ester carboxylesterase
MDLPGFGKSDSLFPASEENAITKNTLSMETIADWIAEFLDSIGCSTRVHYCGLSMGGYIGWQFWKRHASRLRSIIACHTRARDDTDLIRRGREIAARQVRITGAKPVADALVKKLFYQGRPGLKSAKFFNQVHSVISTTAPQSIAAGHLAMAARQDASDWLRDIEVSTLFIAGEHDAITPATEMRANSELVPNSEFAILANSGHMSPLENPDAFNATLDKFLASQT